MSFLIIFSLYTAGEGPSLFNPPSENDEAEPIARVNPFISWLRRGFYIAIGARL